LPKIAYTYPAVHGASFTEAEVKKFLTVLPGLADSTKADAPPVWNFKEVVEPAAAAPLLPFEAKNSTAVVTVGVGEKGRQWLDISEPSMRAYADRIGSDFHAITDTTTIYPFAEKFRVAHFLDAYERIVFLDADIVVRPDAVNLFDFVPANAIGLHDDLPYNTSGYAWYYSEVEHVQRSQRMRLRPLMNCWNTGVIVLSRPHKGILTPPKYPYQALHCSEQHHINILIAEFGFPVFNLPTWVHWQWWLDRQKNLYPKGQFLHFAGELDHKNRLDLMRQAVKDIAPAPQPKKGCGCGPKTRPLQNV
jgi:hypothetical protein